MVEVVDPDDGAAGFEQAACEAESDKARRPGDDNGLGGRGHHLNIAIMALKTPKRLGSMTHRAFMTLTRVVRYRYSRDIGLDESHLQRLVCASFRRLLWSRGLLSLS
jgi:hypothetical protein